jgi:hypothetical protein
MLTTYFHLVQKFITELHIHYSIRLKNLVLNEVPGELLSELLRAFLN